MDVHNTSDFPSCHPLREHLLNYWFWPALDDISRLEKFPSALFSPETGTHLPGGCTMDLMAEPGSLLPLFPKRSHLHSRVNSTKLKIMKHVELSNSAI